MDNTLKKTEVAQENAFEFQKFDDAMRKILSVSHDELKKREEEWKKNRKAKKRAKT